MILPVVSLNTFLLAHIRPHLPFLSDSNSRKDPKATVQPWWTGETLLDLNAPVPPNIDTRNPIEQSVYAAALGYIYRTPCLSPGCVLWH